MKTIYFFAPLLPLLVLGVYEMALHIWKITRWHRRRFVCWLVGCRIFEVNGDHGCGRCDTNVAYFRGPLTWIRIPGLWDKADE